jgi:hypothetical protein
LVIFFPGKQVKDTTTDLTIFVCLINKRPIVKYFVSYYYERRNYVKVIYITEKMATLYSNNRGNGCWNFF